MVSCSSCNSDKPAEEKPLQKEVVKKVLITPPKHVDKSVRTVKAVDLENIADTMKMDLETIEKVGPKYSMGPQGFGGFPACMAEKDIIKNHAIRSCPNTGVDTDYRCFTFDKTKKENSAMIELWSKNGKLVRVLARNSIFKTIHAISTNDNLLNVRALYKDVEYFKSENGQWVVSVPAMNMNFYLDNDTAKTSTELDRFTKISAIEVIFPCSFEAENKEAVKDVAKENTPK